MATTPRSGVGISATSDDRPTKNPSWFTGIVLPSARRLASGAGKILSSIVSESSSSEDEEDASEDGLNDGSRPGSNELSEKTAVPSQNMHGIQTKQLIEKLIGQEIFSREEFDRLTSVLKSRVLEYSLDSGERNLFSPPATVEAQDDGVAHEKAIQEAKRWLQDKREGGSTPAIKPALGNNSRSSDIDHASHGEGSPIDVARSYMKERAPWASPTRHTELQTPLTTTKKSFEEVAALSVGYDSLSSSKNIRKRSYLASGSWNIEEEKRRVRSKAIDDLLRASSSKVDTSSFSVAPSRESLGTGQALLFSRENMVKLESAKKYNPTNALLDAGMSSGPSLAGPESGQDNSAHELFPSAIAALSKGQEAVQAEVEYAAAKPIQPHSPSFAEENHTDAHSLKINESPTDAAGNSNATNGFSTSKSSMPTSLDIARNSTEHTDKNDAGDPVNGNMPSSSIDLDSDCVLNETYMEEPPIVMEPVMVSEDSMGVQHESSLPHPVLPTTSKSRKPTKKTSTRRGRGK